ncbi:MAG: hypothetical protein V3U37_07425 [Nitrospinaceae bacterium]
MQDGPNSCIDCHRDLEDKRLSEPVTLWSKSVHAEVGNTCDGCHGGDPDDSGKNSMAEENNFYAAPKKEEIVEFCGKCHKELSENFMTSAHGETGEQTCIDCHGTHTIRRISIDIINEDLCSECHEYESAGELKSILMGLHHNFQLAESRLQLVKGFPTDPVRKDLKKIWRDLRQVRMISHTFDVSQVEDEAKKVNASIMEVGREIVRLAKMAEDRAFWGYITILVFIGLVILTYFYIKQSRELD